MAYLWPTFQKHRAMRRNWLLLLATTALISGALGVFWFLKTNKASIPASDIWFVEEIVSGNQLRISGKGKQIDVELCGVEVPTNSEQEAQLHLQRLVDESGSQVAIAFLAQTPEGVPVVEAWIHAEKQEEESLNGLLLLKGLAIINQQTIDLCLNRDVFKREAKF